MRRAQFRIRTLLFAVWLAALCCVGTADVLREQRDRARVEVAEVHVHADGSSSGTLIYGHTTSYFLGPIPLGPCPVAVLSAVAFAASVLVWMLGRRFKA